VATPWRAL